MKAFEKKGGNWLEPAKNFILASNQAQITALNDNLQEKGQFLKKAGSNLLLADRKIKYFPRPAWEILVNLPVFGAEPRSGEAKIAFQKDENLTMLRRKDSNLQPTPYIYPKITSRDGLYHSPEN